jgi:hypothetical protein
MAAHIMVPMGIAAYDGKSFIEVTGVAEVLPSGAKPYTPSNPRSPVPGYDMKFFDDNLQPVRLNVMAGTEGTIDIRLWVDYSFWEAPDGPSIGPFHPHSLPITNTGTVLCSCSWRYACTKQGELSEMEHYSATDSAVNDSFQVTIDSPTSNPNPKPSTPYVQFYPVVRFTGEGTQVAKRLKPIIAYLNVYGKVEPPPVPPPPAKKYPEKMITVIPFAKEGQRELDGAARSIASDWVKVMFDTYPKFKMPMMHGDLPVYFVGYASKTGPKGEKDEQKIDDYNVEIGEARAINVKKYLQPLLGSKADLTYRSVGRQEAEWATVYDEKLKKTVQVVGQPRDIDRVVVVWADYKKMTAILNQ